MSGEHRVEAGLVRNNMEGFVGNPGNVSLTPVFGNPNMGWYAQCQLQPPGNSGGFVENPSFVYQARGGGGVGHTPNIGYQVGHGVDGSQLTSLVSRSNVGGDRSDESVDDRLPVKKVKFLCSFGGKILPRPSDGVLRYVGGQTRIISVRKDICFQELMRKMIDVYGKPVVIKYQLPDGELDDLVSVSCPEDFENMMDEYRKLVESSSDGSAKLRIFLFPASELDSSGLLQFGNLLDSGQRYIDAVNGFPERSDSGITRESSIGSAVSTPNSDGPVGGSEGVDGSGHGQGNGGGLSSPRIISPRVGVVASHDASAGLVHVPPNPLGYATSLPLGPPGIVDGFPQNLSTLQSDTEFKRPLHAIGQPQVPLEYDLQRMPGMDFLQATSYMHPYFDPHQHLSSQGGYLNPQRAAVAGSIYKYAESQPQFRDNVVGIANQQAIPARSMPLTSLDHHVAAPTDVVQQVMQPPQTRGDSYLGENTIMHRVVQLPVEQSYSVYQPQSMPYLPIEQQFGVYQPQSPPYQPTVQLQAGGCGMVPPAQHTALSDGRLPCHPGNLPEKLPSFRDCFICQDPLPHAHSDTVVPDHINRVNSVVSNANLIYHSVHLEDKLGAQLNRDVSGASIDAEYQGYGTQPTADSQINLVASSRPGFFQDIEVQPDKTKILQKLDTPDNSEVLFSQGVMGKVVDVKSPYGVVLNGGPQSLHVGAIQHYNLPDQVKEELLVSSPVGSDFSPVNEIPGHTAKPVFLGSSTVHSGDHGVKEEASSHGSQPEVLRSYAQYTSPVDHIQMEDFSITRAQNPGQETFPSSEFTQPGAFPDPDHLMPTGTLPSSSSEVAHLESSHPALSDQITKPVEFGLSEPYSHLNIGTHLTSSEELLHSTPAVSAVDSDCVAYKTRPVGGRKDEALGFQSRAVTDDAMVYPSGPSSGNTSSTYDEMFHGNWEHSTSNSLFSNNDPWTLRYGPHFLPPKTDEEVGNGEAFHTRAEEFLYKPSGCPNEDLNSEHKLSNEELPDAYVRQELKAVAEGVAAMVLQNESSPELRHGGLLDSGVEAQTTDDVKDVKTELAEKENNGFPLSEGIGRLQIIKNSDLEELRELGSGTFGTVYHGKWRGSDVAIKRINDRCFSGKPSEQSRMIDDFWNEAIKLADLHHPNVVAFYGIVLDGPGNSVATVTEYMVNGSLRQALRRTIDRRKRLMIAMDVAFGMEYLHGKNIVHFDLKSDNLLVNLRDPHRPICKVGDLGLSKVKCHTLISGGVRGTLPWMAPELLNGSSSLVSEKVDVFSFGIVMWELLTGEEPYADLHYGVIIGGILSNTLRPAVPESCDPEWRSLMEKCWSSETLERPSFTEIADQLRSMAASLPPKGQAQQK